MIPGVFRTRGVRVRENRPGQRAHMAYTEAAVRVLLPPLLLVVLALGLTGCVPHWRVQDTRTPALDVTGPAPDVIVLGVSGRCSPPCVAPRDNWDYLSSRGTLDAVADVYSAAGYTVQVAGYASHPAHMHTSPYLSRPQPGFAALVTDLQRVQETWLGAARPPRLVLVAHSHGVVWSHLLTRVFPTVRFEMQVDLDGLCVAWRSDYRSSVQALPAASADQPQPLDACEPVRVAGRTVPLKDVVWPNVAANLEVQSKRVPARTGPSGGLPVNYLFETSRNVRLDGSAAGITRFVSVREDHSAVTYPNSDSVRWVTAQLRERLTTWPPPPARSGPGGPADGPPAGAPP